ncbi:unnamed protein product [Acanthoscelides obtectus]|uniref:Uncharacterized protein n=1 Tax=Acanthoscelides obtectus TaxID=200917 RepID=A0A9P0K9B4_ACAOB|nr:unnamed protein product [Acanthoscelides obtectus]CAK1629377.1 hypothetical protein AOBTE_LOCUS5708 [Acanthoscelides obtectus]
MYACFREEEIARRQHASHQHNSQQQQQQHTDQQQQHHQHQQTHQVQGTIGVSYGSIDMGGQIIIEGVMPDMIKPDPLSIEGN